MSGEVVDTVTSQQEGSESSLGPFYVKFGVSLWVLSLPQSVQGNFKLFVGRNGTVDGCVCLC